MVKERYQTKVAVFLILARMKNDNKKEILLQKRINTGYMDNMYDFAASGHLEKGESLVESVIRETKEEIDVVVSKENLKLINVQHHYKEDYIRVFFYTEKYVGTPKINEPNKCGDLSWFDINQLPENVIPANKRVLDCFGKETYLDKEEV